MSGTSNYIPLDGGLILGAGGRYAVNRRINVSLEGRFNIGVTNIVSRPVMNSLTIYTLASHISLSGFTIHPVITEKSVE
ncbi:MAG: hypothetical protein IPN36_12535 [Bacteroidetes bacterium]|nr:hypothetical protein [Bacteroidota bacterium]